MAVELLAVGMTTPVGLTARATAAAVRAGISRVEESHIYNHRLEPLCMGLLADEHLPPLSASLKQVTREESERHRRLLRLATRALRESTERWPPGLPLPLLLALPEPWPGEPDPVGPSFLEHLSRQTGLAWDGRLSQVVREGRAGGLLALQRGLELIDNRSADIVCVGGLDTYMDKALLGHLDREGRLQHSGVSDGFRPGEGAAFLLLGARGTAVRLGLEPMARVWGVGSGFEPGHLYSDQPYLGEGLDSAFRSLFGSLPAGLPRVACVYAGLNGEHFWAKQWGVSLMRHHQHFEEDHRVEHPAENIGDPGAALGPLTVGLAALGMAGHYRPSPCLVWCSSDRGACAATLVQTMKAA